MHYAVAGCARWIARNRGGRYGPASKMRCSLETDHSLQLREIARALNVPVQSFFDVAQSGSDLTATTELLRCWQRITNAGDRDRLLQLARKLSNRPQESRLAAE